MSKQVFSLQLYPNPADTDLHVNCYSEIDNIAISDISGLLFFERLLLPFQQMGIDMSVLVSGVYIICATADKGIIHRQLTALNR